MSIPLILSHNENSYGCSPQVLKALQAPAAVHCYPETAAISLKNKLAATFSLNPEQIMCSHGSVELLYLATLLFSNPGDEILFHAHSFHVYRHAVKLARAKAVVIPQSTLQFDVDKILEYVTSTTKMIIIDTPANPLGCILTNSEILRLISNIPSTTLLILDEAYAEFVTDPDYTSGLDLVREYPNIIVTRSFSKIYGLAGLRLGWGYASPEIATTINKNLSPFTVNSSALTAGIAALEDPAWIENIGKKIIRNRESLSAFFRKHQIEQLPSHGNFILFKMPNPTFNTYLQTHQIILRPGSLWGLPDHLRITIGRTAEMQQFYDCYEKWHAPIAT